MKNLICVSKLSKKYDTLNLKNMTFDIKKGEIISVLGANGSGKTTLLRMLSTNIKPDSGTIIYNLSNKDNQITDNQISDIRKKLGVLFETSSLYGCMTISENLDFFADLYGIKQKKDLVNTSLNLSGVLNRKDCLVDSLSYGLKRRADIARVFVTDPDVIILDEPFKGLDAKTISELKQRFLDYSIFGKTIIFSTNDYVDAYDIATKSVFLKNNNFYFDTIENIRIKLQSKNG